uniref:ABC transporter domain-containing protein n=1 Tax=Anisakis simplex TaxID=6269 RepID=A0A0M3K8V1_ANISI
LALMIWSALIMPSAKVQPSLPITMKPYSDADHAANVYVQNASVFPALWNCTLPQLINETIRAQNPEVPFNETVSGNISKLILHDTTSGPPRIGVPEGMAWKPTTLGTNEPNFATDLTLTGGLVPFTVALRIYGLDTSHTHKSVPYLHDEHILAMFNNFGLATPALALSIADSAIMRLATNKNLSLLVSNHPLPPTTADQLKNKIVNNTPASIIAYAIVTSMSLVVSGFAYFLIRERRTNSKHMQMMSGLNPLTYWSMAYLWDICCFLLTIVLFIGVICGLDVKEYTSRSDVPFQLLLVMLLTGWAQIPFVYVFSFAFTSPPKGYTLIVMYNIITGMIGLLTVPIIAQAVNKDVAETHLQAELVLPYRIYSEDVLSETGRRGILTELLFLTIHGIVFWIVMMIIEYDLFSKLKYAIGRRKRDKIADSSTLFADAEFLDTAEMRKQSTSSLDSDVALEQYTVQNKHPAESAVVVRDLHKQYGKLHAVNGISFHVEKESCFGLLGVNGAGKTSTFQMLCGENRISSGDAFIKGYSVKNNWKKASLHVGYCPQFDAVIEEMSGEETLKMFARIRGIHETDITPMVNATIRAIGVERYAKRQIKTYSGGNKRRLSLGIALVALPDVLLLDEPTTGVDPKARRLVWNILSKVREQGTAIILTSHTMEECEALCTELAIMVSGRFRCIGSAQHLKSKQVISSIVIAIFSGNLVSRRSALSTTSHCLATCTNTKMWQSDPQIS